MAVMLIYEKVNICGDMLGPWFTPVMAARVFRRIISSVRGEIWKVIGSSYVSPLATVPPWALS